MAAVAPEKATPLRLELAGQLPSGKGGIRIAVIRGRVMKFPKPRFVAWRSAAIQQVLAQKHGVPILTGKASVRVRYWPGDRIRRDVPGMIDALCHLLEHCPVCRKKNKTCEIPVVADDSLLIHWDWETMPLDRERPRAEIEITPTTEPA